MAAEFESASNRCLSGVVGLDSSQQPCGVFFSDPRASGVATFLLRPSSSHAHGGALAHLILGEFVGEFKIYAKRLDGFPIRAVPDIPPAMGFLPSD
jgi:hypothetical protein